LIVTDLVYEGLSMPSHLETLRWHDPLPLATLFAVKYDSRELSEAKRAATFYAESWALVHYLVLGPDERRGQVNRFVDLLQAGRPASDAAREAFGDLEKLDKELRSYVRSPAISYRRRAARVEVNDKAWTARPLPEPESLAIRAGFHVAMGRGAEARALAGRSLALDPSHPAAHEALALLALREGRRNAAREGLGMATSLPGASDYAHYLDALLQDLSEPRKSEGGLYFDPQGADFGLWIDAFKDEVYRNWAVPTAVASGGFRGQVDLEFTVERDGCAC
jgi:hypothetical protein